MQKVKNVTAITTGNNHDKIAEKMTTVFATSIFNDENDFRSKETQILGVVCSRLEIDTPDNFEYTIEMVDV